MLSRILTTAYSLFGVPLFLLYLSVTGERLARLIVRLSGSCSDSCQQRRRHHRELNHRSNSNAYNSDGAAMLAGTSFGQLNHASGGGSNGHAVHESVTDDSVIHDDRRSSSSCCCCCSSAAIIGRRQVPVLICAGLLAVLAVTGVLMLSWLDPSLDYDDSLHLLANLLLTLGFAGHLLPGLSAESSSNGSGSGSSSTTTTTTTTSVLLLATATLIILGMTLLSAMFNVIVECITSSNSEAMVSSDPGCVSSSHYRPHVTYRHVPSPSQQIAWQLEQITPL